MEDNMEQETSRTRIAQKKGGWHFKQRAIAAVLTLMMIFSSFSSSGIQVLAEELQPDAAVAVEELEAEEPEAETPETADGSETPDPEPETQSTVTEETEEEPSEQPTEEPSEEPSEEPTEEPSEEPAEEPSEEPTEEETTSDPAEEPTGTTSVRRSAVRRAAAAKTTATGVVDSDGNLDITNLMTGDSYLMVRVNGTYYTLEELAENGLKVPKGATVFAHLEWDVITGIEAGQKLVYQIPKDMITGVVAEDRFMFTDNHDTFAGYMSLTSDGLFTVEIDSNYFKTWSNKQGTSTLELDFLTLEFYGTLADSHGETSSDDDHKIVFAGETEANPESGITFEIPFEYKNENSTVKVEKSSTFHPAGQTVTYTVKVYTPKDNTMTSENVKLTDAFAAKTYLVAANGSGTGVYRDVKATLYTNTNNGASLTGGTDITSKFALNKLSNGVLTIGDMEPDSMVVLEYTVKVDDKFFSTTQQNTILNQAQASYNDTTSNIAASEQDCSGTAKITKSVGSIVTESNGDAYLLYTVKVTAYGKVTNLTVKDNFTKDAVAIKELKDITASTGSCPDPSDKNLVWTIPSLEDKQTATLTYKAYLDLTAWDYASSVTSDGSAVQKERDIINQADLYLGDDYLTYATAEKKITKTWVNKTGTKDSSGKLNYTLYINSDPMASDITSIYDQLSSDSTGATINYPITVNVYKSSTSKTQVATYSLSSSTTGFTASSTGWNLDLTTYDGGKLNGKGYYYEITYSVNGGSSSNVTNGAGINRGPDISYGEGTTIQVKTITAYKGKTAVNFRDGYISWESTMETDIDAGTVYTDWIDDDKVGIDGHWQWDSTGYWWYSMEDIDGVEVYQGDELIYSKAKGINLYDITVEPWDYNNKNDPNKRQPVTIPYWTYTVNENGTYTWTNDKTKYGKIGYYGFKVTFGKAIDVEGVDNVVIKYNCSCSWENMYHFAMTKYPAATGALCYQMQTYNKSEWTLGMGATSGVRSDNLTVYNTNDVLKGSSYDATTGIITWKVYINRQGDMIGDATVEDILPAGLEYIDGSAKLSYNISSSGDSSGKTYIGSNFNENNRNNSYGNIKQVDGADAVTVEKRTDGTTKLTVLLENLRGFSFNTYTQNADGTYSYVQSNNYDSGWYQDGNVVLTIQTRIKDEMLLQGVDETFKNAVTVTNATMASGSATAYATQTIKQTSDDVLKKTMDNYTSGTVLTFNMDINSEGGDLIYNSDKLEIMDVMSSKMSLATHRDNYFVVTDSAGNQLTAATSENIKSNEYYLTEVESESGTAYKIIVPDGKKLHIQYLVTMDAAVGEWVDISNKAYFVYEGLQPNDTGSEVTDRVQISRAKGGSGASADNPTFKIYKKDQWGNPVSGVTFTLYKVTLSSDGKEASKSAVATETTDATGYVQFKDLDEYGVYCFYETTVPTGYEKSEEGTYFYFTAQSNLNIDGAIGIDYNEKVFDVTNNFKAASLTVPMQKTINGEEQNTAKEFSFTLAKTSGADMYSDEACLNKVTSFTASIEGGGTINFNTLYFKNVGEYKFTLSENDLTQEETNEGFRKDSTVYNITVNVANGDNGLYLSSATYTWKDDTGATQTGDLLKKGTPVFNNTLTLEPVTIQLNGIKKLTGNRSYAIKAGEFKFNVVENGEVIATGKTAAGSSNGTSSIVFDSITYDQDDLGTHVLTIYEVATNNDFSITYCETKFFAVVTVEPIAGQSKLQATITYSTQDKSLLDETTGYPIFINEYTAIPSTGINLDVMPYVMILTLAACVTVPTLLRRRKHE